MHKIYPHPDNFTNKISIGYNIKKIRELRGYKQKHIATILGLNQSTYHRIENGSISITDEQLIVVSAELRVPIETIKDFDVDTILNIKSGLDENNSENTLSLPKRKVLTEMINSLSNPVKAFELLLKLIKVD